MPTYVEYQLDEKTTVLIEISDLAESSKPKPTRGIETIAKVKAKKSFSDALKEVKVQAKLLLTEIEELHVEEAEVKFGINTVGELGNMAVGKVGLGVNYEVTLKWKKPSKDV